MPNQLTFFDPNRIPFDSIKQTRPDGTEYWSARELQPLLGYDSWRRFDETIDRAKVACENSGHKVSGHFAGADKTSDMPNGGSRSLEDYHLTRYACYLVAMNGDPRKPEIAAAQTYFAVQTHRQEQADAGARQIPRSFAEALRLAADQAEQIERQQAMLQVMAPKADFHDQVAGSEDCQSIQLVAKVLNTGEIRLFRWLREQGILMENPRNQPYQQYVDRGYFRVIEQTRVAKNGQTHIHPKTLVTGKGLIWLQQKIDQADRPPGRAM